MKRDHLRWIVLTVCRISTITLSNLVAINTDHVSFNRSSKRQTATRRTKCFESYDQIRYNLWPTCLEIT